MKHSAEKQPKQGRAWLPKLSLWTFTHSRTVALIWLALAIFGIASYTTLLKREGFPSIEVPFSVVNGTYFVNDPAKVDAEIAKPVGEIILQDDRVSSVQTTSRGMFYNVVVQYKEGTSADRAGEELQKKIQDAKVLPSQATIEFTTPKFGFTQRGDDAVVSLYAKEGGKSTADLAAEGERLAAFIRERNLPTVGEVSLIDPFVDGVDPATGISATSQTLFDRYGERQENKNVFFDSVAVGITQKQGADVIELDDQLQAAVTEYNNQNNTGFEASLSASFAPEIKSQIGELQRALIEGLLAVLIVGSIVIAIRASIITVLAMFTVLAITLGVLLAIGYSLNTITLFSLILCLALIVDDTIIMIEAIDAQRRRRKDPSKTVEVATRKISRAMVAATFTAALSFAPLLFVGGILGGFIRAVPVTVITSLLVSLIVALIFIPVFARYLLLGKKQMGAENVHEPAAKVEAKIAHFISRPMLWARGSTKRLFTVGMCAVLVGTSFIVASGFIFQKVTFNIFPPTKDTNGLIVNLSFPPGATVEDAMAAAQKSDEIVAQVLGENFEYASYYASGNGQQASLVVRIIPYNQRDVRSPELVAQLQDAYSNFKDASVELGQQDIGPPSSPFVVRIQTDDRQAAQRLAVDMQKFLQDNVFVRPSGEEARVVSSSVSDPGSYNRADGKSYMSVSATFDGDDTTTLVTLGKTAVEKEFTPEKLAQYGLSQDVLQFDFGQESENQDSFTTLLYAFPATLFVIYLLLALQFRSLSQPLLIFLAIPFSLFGITLGLYLTDNAFSFFAMLGFFALIGLSLKNTILLTDYANQQRRLGVPVVDAAVEALGERFRPLVATSLTAIVSLTPLAILSPFWEGLAVVLIFGLLSSTLLVVLVFPYYYLGVEFLRMRVGRKYGLTWFLLSVALLATLVSVGLPQIALLAPVAVGLAMWLAVRRRHKRV